MDAQADRSGAEKRVTDEEQSRKAPALRLAKWQPRTPLTSRRTGAGDGSASRTRAVQITRFGGPEVRDVVDLPDPTPGEGQQLFEVSTAGVTYADTRHSVSGN